MCRKETPGQSSAGRLRFPAKISRLLDPKVQESFYGKIVARYMQFCSQHSKDLDQAFASLSIQNEAPNDSRVRPDHLNQARDAFASASSTEILAQNISITPSMILSASEMSIILTALRKLREGLLATSSRTASPVFAQRVHIFNIKLAILAQHPESYRPSLLHLLSKLHTSEHPLARTELFEMTSFLIVDFAARQRDLGSAFALRYNSRVGFGFRNRNIDMLLQSIVTNDWVLFWSTRRKVDGYLRALLHPYVDRLHMSVLKAIGRSYMACDVQWIVSSATGNELDWSELVKKENIGWIRDGDKVIIRKPKLKPS